MAAEPWSGERIEKRWAFSSYFPATKKTLSLPQGLMKENIDCLRLI
uniref:Uncharacterized protein n=1 Tax=Anguilla anguilla TaxID=7936 RepID=A0A0E9XJE1_ANGAN